MVILALRRRHGARDVPLGHMQPVPQRVDADVRMARPFSQGHRTAAMGYWRETGLIMSLLLPRRPPAVLWRVLSVVVYAVNRVRARRAQTHVSVKRREVIPPTVAHGYSSSAIIRECGIATIVTTALHAAPSAILGRAVAAMHRCSLARKVQPVTTARCGFTRSQKAGADHFLRTAIAAAQDGPSKSWRNWRQSNDNQAAESRTDMQKHKTKHTIEDARQEQNRLAALARVA